MENRKKRERIESALKEVDGGDVYIVVNRDGKHRYHLPLVIPKSIKVKSFKLCFGRELIPDMSLDDIAISGTLSFSSRKFFTIVPWECVDGFKFPLHDKYVSFVPCVVVYMEEWKKRQRARRARRAR